MYTTCGCVPKKKFRESSTRKKAGKVGRKGDREREVKKKKERLMLVA
jgi:hypothetical protein